MSYQSLQDDTVRVEYTPGQPKGAVAGHNGTTPHRIDIARKEGADDPQYFPGTVSSHFILRKNSTNNGYTETEIDDVGTQSDGRITDCSMFCCSSSRRAQSDDRLTDDQIASLMQMVRMLEDLLGCPVDIEFGIDRLVKCSCCKCALSLDSLGVWILPCPHPHSKRLWSEASESAKATVPDPFGWLISKGWPVTKL